MAIEAVGKGAPDAPVMTLKIDVVSNKTGWSRPILGPAEKVVAPPPSLLGKLPKAEPPKKAGAPPATKEDRP